MDSTLIDPILLDPVLLDPALLDPTLLDLVPDISVPIDPALIEATVAYKLSKNTVEPQRSTAKNIPASEQKLQADKRAEKAAAVWSDVVQEVACYYQVLDTIAAQHGVNPEQLKEKVFARASLKNEQKVNPFNAFVHFKAVQYKEGSV
ncbi:uncharacterized protein FOMMEDRAFT_163114 [Fomitiporia mediterranea MF3/22]|uniref:Uncharacterized protein n=1 Tax=Fomitiporia mediterranea (strain MF3/22) TaxID=694068 RepID=R7SGQ3_FOMME|nr:uncharacterized protein FOMMEDRAFT_163114 [Fomitiporia mediterranea MF3/22]EJC97487.1 hypothetical protein FOMMEDRAFT_163114 [Fomitiporia mediterranea MF3/22]